MKVCVVTGYTPTEENTRGISGLIYSLLKYRPSYVDLRILTFNFNRIQQTQIEDLQVELNAEIKEVKPPRWIKLFTNVWMWRISKFFMRLPLECYMVTDKLVKTVRAENADLVFVYPYFFYKLAHKMPEKKFVVSGCDCEALIRARYFKTQTCLMNNKVLRHNYVMLKKGLRFESEWNLSNIKVHFVGMEDCLFYEQIYGYQNSHFLLHPHYALAEKNVRFSTPKIKVLLAGSYDVYMKDDIDRMLSNLLKYKKELLQNFEFTILGKNWGTIKEFFIQNEFSCEFKEWVDDYADELIQHDIQLAPISYGTGTKGKVLSGLGNGLLVVGSKFAFENICVRHNESCFRYHRASEIASALLMIAKNRTMYEDVARKGREQVRKYHSPRRISKRFFEIYG